VVVIGIAVWIIILIVHNMSDNARVRHDSALTRKDMEIRSAPLSVKCRAVQEINGKESIGPPCSSATKSSALVIELRGVPRNVRFRSSPGPRGTYSASCTLIAGGDAVAGSEQLLSRPSKQTIDFDFARVSLPLNACIVSPSEAVQSVEIDIVRWSIGDSNSATSFTIRQFRRKIHRNWYRLDASLYRP
jgi:hypothetical protein